VVERMIEKERVGLIDHQSRVRAPLILPQVCADLVCTVRAGKLMLKHC
jgi:hypothetical protein